MKKYTFVLLIQEIINNYSCKFGAVTMNNKFIIWATKKGYVRVISATQQEWTEKGIKWANDAYSKTLKPVDMSNIEII